MIFTRVFHVASQTELGLQKEAFHQKVIQAKGRGRDDPSSTGHLWNKHNSMKSPIETELSPCCQNWICWGLEFLWPVCPRGWGLPVKTHDYIKHNFFLKRNLSCIFSKEREDLLKHLTKLSSLFATIDANLCSPASSEMRNTYSGAVTWLDLWVLPG